MIYAHQACPKHYASKTPKITPQHLGKYPKHLFGGLPSVLSFLNFRSRMLLKHISQQQVAANQIPLSIVAFSRTCSRNSRPEASGLAWVFCTVASQVTLWPRIAFRTPCVLHPVLVRYLCKMMWRTCEPVHI